jgi:predicted SprT family Zn-dependent metalloprotease
MFQERCNQIKAKVNQLIAEYEHRHPGQKVPHIEIRFDLRGRSAGQASARGWNYSMRFNRDMMMNAGWDHLLNDTVPHELAHIICFANGSDRGHGYNWKRTCQALGGTGERCHSEAVVYAKGRTFVYTTSTGTTVNLSETKHRKIQQGAAYTFKDRSKGRLDRACSYSVLGTTTVVQPAVQTKAVPVETLLPKAAPVTAPWNLPLGASKADQVRARIAVAKNNGEGSSAVVNYAVTVLGMTLALAKTYVKNNWSKA